MTFQELCKYLENKIQQAYEQGVTIEDAEKLSGEFLVAMMKVSDELKNADLDSRMRKSGLKAIRAAIYLDAATKDPKKPSDVMLEAIVNTNDIVAAEQKAYDEVEANKDNVERYYNIFRESHIHFRAIAKGRFDG